ncbi:hypothetical protein [Desulfitobacterium sp. LBE]|nr:hypothetical protein [Desulfitobacterium sp. LBE]
MPEALFGIEYALCYPRHTPAGSPANEGFQLFPYFLLGGKYLSFIILTP